MKTKRFHLTCELDQIFAYSGVIFSIFLIIYLWMSRYNVTFLVIGIFTLFFCAAWLFMRKKTSLEKLVRESRFICMALQIIFFVFLTSSILSLCFRPDLYARPLLYFVLISLMSGVLALEVLFSPKNKMFLGMILFQIIIMGLSIQWSQMLLFPSVVGADPWWHQMFTSKILEIGYIPDGHLYSSLPIMHLEIGSVSLITGLNYKISTMFSISFFQILISVIFLFLLGKFLFNNIIGLLSGLLLITAGVYYIHMGLWTVPNTIAATLILVIVYLLFKIRGENPFVGTTLTMIFMIILVLTHTITAMCLAILLFVIFISFKAFKVLYYKPGRTPVKFNISIFFSVIMFAWWTYAAFRFICSLADFIELGFSRDTVYQNAPLYVLSIPVSEQIFNVLGMFLFFSFSFIGCFYMLSKKGTPYTFTSAALGITALSIGFFPLVIGHSVIEIRWWYFAQMLLALPLAVTFLLFSGLFKKNNLRSLFIFSFTVFLTFIVITSPTANIDNPIFSPNTPGYRSALIESEMQAIKINSKIWNKTMITDGYFARSMDPMEYKAEETKDIEKQLYNKSFLKSEDVLFLFRTEYITSFNLSLAYNLDNYLNQLLEHQKFIKIYDCASVKSFVKT